MNTHNTKNTMTNGSVEDLIGILMAISVTARDWARELIQTVDLRQPGKGEDHGKECQDSTGR